MANVEAKMEQNPPMKMQKVSHGAQICLRTLAVVFTLSATCVVVTAKQATVVYGINFDAKYSYSSAYKFFAFANAFACALSLISLVFAIVLERGGYNPFYFFFLFLHDLLMTLLVMAGVAAAIAIGFVGRYGNSHTGWMAICDNFGKFCNRITTSVVLSFFALFFLLVLTILSANKSRQIQV